MKEQYILIIEDDPDESSLIEEVFQKAGINISIKFIKRTDEVIPSLSCNWMPCMILVDYTLYPDDGVEILKTIRSMHQSIPTIIMCENVTPSFVNVCYQAGANSVIQKPTSIKMAHEKVEVFLAYWFDVAVLPTLTTYENFSQQ